MYCPKCATQNIDGAKFCRACGADIIAVLQELTERTPSQDDGARRAASTAAEGPKTDDHSRRETQTQQASTGNFMDDMMGSVFGQTGDQKGSKLPCPPMAPMIKMWKVDESDEAEPGAKKDLSNPWGRRREPRAEDGIQGIFWGIGFICVAIAIGLFMPGGNHWWFWMLIPGFGFLGGGVSEYQRAKAQQQHVAASSVGEPARVSEAPAMHAQPSASMRTTALPDRTSIGAEHFERSTAEIVRQPGSVTEGTTRHLDASNAGDNASHLDPRVSQGRREEM